MWRGILVFLLLAISTVAADAQRRQINPIPFSHEPCSVLDGRPCTPYYCSPLEPGPCIPEIDYPYGQNLQLTIETVPAEADRAKYQKPDHDLDTIGDLFAELRTCWSPPSDNARAGMQMAVRFSFNKAGGMIGPPQPDLCDRGRPGRYPNDLSQRDQFIAESLPAAQIHQRPRRRAGRAPDRDPLCR